MAEEKDGWDKADITLKAVTPIVVAIALLVWNNQQSELQMASTMTGIAVGVLSEEPKGDGRDPLREWAISVLQNPSSPPVLSDEAASQLRATNLAWRFDSNLFELKGLLENLATETPRKLGDDLQ